MLDAGVSGDISFYYSCLDGGELCRRNVGLDWVFSLSSILFLKIELSGLLDCEISQMIIKICQFLHKNQSALIWVNIKKSETS